MNFKANMERAEILQKLEIVIPKVSEYIATKSTQMDLVERQTLQELARIVTPFQKWCFTCSSSLGDLMIAIHCYYERLMKEIDEENAANTDTLPE